MGTHRVAYACGCGYMEYIRRGIGTPTCIVCNIRMKRFIPIKNPQLLPAADEKKEVPSR